MKLRNILIKVLACSSMLIATSSCSSFLDREPQGQAVDTPVYYDDVENAQMAVNACYQAIAQDQGVVAHMQEWMFGEVMSDNSWKGGSDFGDMQDVQMLKEWTAVNVNATSHSAWKTYYQAIHRANTAIKGISPATSFDAEIRDQLVGEALFIRAYSYFYLVRLFGDVPLFTEPVSPDQIGAAGRTPVKEVLTQIEADFAEAAEKLGTKSEMEVGRATSGAAKAYQARVVMYDIGIWNANGHTWQEVFDLTNEVITSNQYSLAFNLATVFEKDGENGTGSIFEVQHETSNTGWANQNTGSTSPILTAPRGTADIKGWGWGFLNPTQDLVDEFEANDPRLDWTAGQDGQFAHGVAQGVAESQFLSGYFPRKVLMDQALRPNEQSDNPQNQRKFRYADILLMNAEAAYHIGNEATARQRVNEVRDRARSMTYPKGWNEADNTYAERDNSGALPEVTATGEQLLEAIYHERRVELALEGLRLWDLMRTGKLETALKKDNIGYREGITGDIVVGNMDGKKLNGIPVLPIPAAEVASFGLTQNPGY
ncbi:RagB/SusD family nutrient uptake outer membrane protein [Flammeovirga sp. MY04]|uniref:RagB/SusD family protein n=1 Tax=Flammeovirga yaeyamensis TaxID=367791 RepID=D0PR20_9BACT|nr:RagB/SusD family nutrient uptake outer membrane protein [Flammeovirga sp. MY04]ACY02063.1 RagB/SusD family protein [Flammeovirga yaeyamensis]ANQ52753.1 RagB/SusD family nutrient uptake outer membrane protein [Flammeovirga sp. MY04]